jgi:hypothetical protein
MLNGRSPSVASRSGAGVAAGQRQRDALPWNQRLRPQHHGRIGLHQHWSLQPLRGHLDVGWQAFEAKALRHGTPDNQGAIGTGLGAGRFSSVARRWASRSSSLPPLSRMARLTPAVASAMMEITTSNSSKVKSGVFELSHEGVSGGIADVKRDGGRFAAGQPQGETRL